MKLLLTSHHSLPVDDVTSIISPGLHHVSILLHHHYIITILTVGQGHHWMMPGNYTTPHTMSLMMEMMAEGAVARWEEDHVILSIEGCNDSQLVSWEHPVTCEHSLI